MLNIVKRYSSDFKSEGTCLYSVDGTDYIAHITKSTISVDYDQPNGDNYPDTPEGNQQFVDDYWNGDIEAMLYHEDMGDR